MPQALQDPESTKDGLKQCPHPCTAVGASAFVTEPVNCAGNLWKQSGLLKILEQRGKKKKVVNTVFHLDL